MFRTTVCLPALRSGSRVAETPLWSVTHTVMGRRVVTCGALRSVGPGAGSQGSLPGDGNVPYLDLLMVRSGLLKFTKLYTLRCVYCTAWKLYFNKVLSA